MSFHLSAEGIHLDGHILKGKLRAINGEYHDTELNLDECLGNQNGQFFWDGQNFSQTARNLEFRIEGGADVPVLRAELRDIAGNWIARDVNLAERIENQDGRFVFI